MSKGSSPRPFLVSNQEYSSRWDAIFGKDNDQKENNEKALGTDKSSESRDIGRGSDSNPPARQVKNAGAGSTRSNVKGYGHFD
jgi:hypothetical protein